MTHHSGKTELTLHDNYVEQFVIAIVTVVRAFGDGDTVVARESADPDVCARRALAVHENFRGEFARGVFVKIDIDMVSMRERIERVFEIVSNGLECPPQEQTLVAIRRLTDGPGHINLFL